MPRRNIYHTCHPCFSVVLGGYTCTACGHRSATKRAHDQHVKAEHTAEEAEKLLDWRTWDRFYADAAPAG